MERNPVLVVEGGRVLVGGGLGIGIEGVWTSSDASEDTVEVVSFVEDTMSSELELDLAGSPCELPYCAGPEPTSTPPLSERITVLLARLQGASRGRGAI
jgi:hypothetical protein